MTSDAPALLDIADGVATVTLNRPAVLNAVDSAMIDALEAILAKIETNAAVRVVVLRGAGDAFMAGGDIGWFRRLLDTHADIAPVSAAIGGLIDKVQALVLRLRALPKPVVAAVHGGCAGFGLSLMLAADLAIAADNAKFTLAYIHLGTTPDGGASFHLPRAVGAKRAAEIALLGNRFGAADAAAWGLVNKVVPLAELDARTAELAARLARGPAAAYARTKALLNQSADATLARQLDDEAAAFVASTATDDFAIAVRAFLEKKPPAFTGK